MTRENASNLQAHDFAVRSIQVSGYISDGRLRTSPVLALVLDRWAHVYDADPISIPIPENAPPEIPTAILASRDGAFRLELFPQRLNLVWHRQADESPQLDNLFVTFGDRLATILAHTQLQAGRLAAVVTRMADHPQPGAALAQQFCKEQWLRGPLNRPEGFELHAHKVFALLPTLDVNSWVRIRTAKGPSRKYEYVLMLHDINTLAEEMDQRRFSQQDIIAFLSAAASQTDSVLQMYFPQPNTLREKRQ